MLSRLRMSVDECLQEYPQIARRAFGKKKSVLGRISTGAKYDATPLVEEIDRLVKLREHHKPPRLGNFDYTRFPSPGDLCRT
jgi:hypothetical protein